MLVDEDGTVVLDVLGGRVVEDDVVVGVVVVVVDDVEDVVVVVVDDVVVVGGVGAGQSSTGGSGPPSSKAMTTERPWASANSSPGSIGGSNGMALTLTEMGFWPVCSRSSSPGFETYLQTQTLRPSGGSPVASETPHAASRVKMNGSHRRISQP